MSVEKLMIHKLKGNPVIAKYAKWKEQNPDESYQYDEIHEFLNSCSRGELQSFFDLVEEAATIEENS